MAKEKSGIGIVVVTSLAVIGALAYMLFRKPKPQGATKIVDGKTGDNVDIEKQTPSTTDNGYSLYAVTTKGDPLNVRITPATTGKTVKQYDNLVAVYARPSAVNGWMEVSDDGKNAVGYSSAQYLRKL